MPRSRTAVALVAVTSAFALAAPVVAGAADEEPPVHQAVHTRSAASPDANQGIGVDKNFVYAVNNSTITKHDKKTGKAVLQFVGAKGGAIEHLDSGVVEKGKLYAAHSNYPEWPMESSIEIFDTKTMEHVGTHSFGIDRGSLTWLDRHDGAWWAGFANYDKVQKGQTEAYGLTYNTQVVKMDDHFRVTQSWTIPKKILNKFSPMSNSGGSWGPDGRLYLTGHDLPEAYVMSVPEAGAELTWHATVKMEGIEGQGIAWDRSAAKPTLWGISRDNKLMQSFTMPVDAVADKPSNIGTVRVP